jgi:CheY-like chemotaxis protein
MIVCAIEDLLFSIKISTAAKQLGVDIYFERTRDRVLPTVREKQPSLVIFDLNSSRLDPMTVIAAMKTDPQLRTVKTLGYVSHVDSDAIAAARQGRNRSGPGAFGVRRAARHDPAVGLDVVSGFSRV